MWRYLQAAQLEAERKQKEEELNESKKVEMTKKEVKPRRKKVIEISDDEQE
jgi:hypothetical protein